MDIVQQRLRQFMERARPHIVILGKNDLFSTCPMTSASLIDDFCELLRSTYGIQTVFVGELFTRQTPRYISAEAYEEKRQRANIYLRTLCEAHAGVRFWAHRRIFNAQTSIFLPDGVHLNNFCQFRFYCSLRPAIMTADGK